MENQIEKNPNDKVSIDFKVTGSAFDHGVESHAIFT
jgi:hypothetical protein